MTKILNHRWLVRNQIEFVVRGIKADIIRTWERNRTTKHRNRKVRGRGLDMFVPEYIDMTVDDYYEQYVNLTFRCSPESYVVDIHLLSEFDKKILLKRLRNYWIQRRRKSGLMP